MKRLIAGSGAVLGLFALVAARPATPLTHFQVMLERSAGGWIAQCDSGCAWTALSVNCARDCKVLIDARGVEADVDSARTDAAFGFVVSRNDRGWQAESAAGTAWTELSWGCMTPSCAAKVTQSGVTLLPGLSHRL